MYLEGTSLPLRELRWQSPVGWCAPSTNMCSFLCSHEDCCHVLSTSISDEEISKYSICSFYSFDSTKWISTGNGGAVASNDKDFMNKLESIKVDQGISDLNCSLGISQIEKIEEFKSKRTEISHQYFKEMPFITKELKNLKRTTLLTLFKVFDECGLEKDRDFNYNQQDQKITFSNKSQIFLIDTAYQPSDPLYKIRRFRTYRMCNR